MEANRENKKFNKSFSSKVKKNNLLPCTVNQNQALNSLEEKGV
jgi:hypothetical protein